ncbi:hypothetical protein Sjap_025271 [Stephania japonica]|uniref:Nucleolus and neural progenitor protein-like N-terminal domain-containing protein n=1 Tax=Stephania japonica TaxID=461633 RepID=A0AAP0E415_9MAGN
MESVVNLKKRFAQFEVESKILDRLVYKNKNQHRRCTYFQYLLKVRRDTRLVQSVRLAEILSNVTLLMDPSRPKDTIRLLESLKGRYSEVKPNFQKQLLGVARLLSQMVEPMVKAAMEISCLLAQSFFMGFSVTILALVARLRILVQQMLLDVVSIFNTITSISQKKHSAKLMQEGIEVTRDYYPPNEVLTLECVWKTDKFMLLEKTEKIKDQDVPSEVGGEVPLGTPSIQYQKIDAFLGEDESDDEMNNDNTLDDIVGNTNYNRHEAESLDIQSTKLSDAKLAEGYENNKNGATSEETLNGHLMAKDVRASYPGTTSPKMETQSGSDALSNSSAANEDRFFRLLTGGAFP